MKLLVFDPRRTMARLLLALGCALPLWGCLIPQDLTVLPPMPCKRNSPPRIVSSTPQVETTVYLPLTSCPLPEFGLIVVDEDLVSEKECDFTVPPAPDASVQYADAIRSQWYIDRSENTLPAPGTTVTASTRAERVLAVPSKLQSAFASLDFTRPHRLEVWVTDGQEFKPDNPAEATGWPRRLPNGTVIEDLAYTDNHVWLIKVEPCVQP